MSILPKIDPTLLPDLVNLVGTFGSGRTSPGFDDRIVIIATIVYETNPGGGII